MNRTHSAALVVIILVVVASPGSVPAPAAAAAEGAKSLAEWRKQVGGLIEEMGLTVRRREKLAYATELSELIKSGAEPRQGFLEELRHLLAILPPGKSLHTLVETLVEDGQPLAIEILFEGLSRDDFSDLKGRPLGEGQTESRRRIIEYYIARLGDAMHESQSSTDPVRLSEALATKLQKELLSKDLRRARCAAYVLGGAAHKGSAGALAEAAAAVENSAITTAILIEALGRTDPKAGAAAILEAAAGGSKLVRLGAIPLLGYLDGKAAEAPMRAALADENWSVRRAAVEACRNRGDVFAMDLLMNSFDAQSPRLKFDMIEVIYALTGGVVPPDPKEWKRWWRQARKDFKPRPVGTGEKEEKKTEVIIKRPKYFGLEVWSDQLAIVLDTSGSMATGGLSLGGSGVGIQGKMKKGSPMDIAKDQSAQLLKSLRRKGTRFNIITYNEKVKQVSEKMISASTRNLNTAMKYLKRLKPDGGTNIYGALVQALADEDVDTIYFLADGEPTEGVRTEPDDILEAMHMINRFRQTRIHTIQLGDDSTLMRSLAELSGGTYRRFEISAEGLNN